MRELTWVAQARSELARVDQPGRPRLTQPPLRALGAGCDCERAAITLGVTVLRRAPTTAGPGPVRGGRSPRRAPRRPWLAGEYPQSSRSRQTARASSTVGNSGTELFVRALDQLEAAELSGLGAPQRRVLLARWPVGRLLRQRHAEESGDHRRTGGDGMARRHRQRAQRRHLGCRRHHHLCDKYLAPGSARVSAAGGERLCSRRPNRERGELSHRLAGVPPGR